MNKKEVVAAILNALCMSAIMSFVMCVVNVGLGSLFIKAWIKGWLVSLAVAFPLSCFLPGRIQKIINKLMAN